MNTEPNKTNREQMEVRIIALLLGESSPFETAEIQAAMQKDPQLAAFHDEMRQTIGFVSEAAKASAQTAEAPKLSPERREALFSQFQAGREVAAERTETTEGAQPGTSSLVYVLRNYRRWLMPVSLAAGVLILVGGLLLPSLAKSKAKASRVAKLAPMLATPTREWLADSGPAKEVEHDSVLTPQRATPIAGIGVDVKDGDVVAQAQAIEESKLDVSGRLTVRKPQPDLVSSEIYMPGATKTAARDDGKETRTFALKNADAAETSELLNTLYAGQKSESGADKEGKVVAMGDLKKNSVTITAPAGELAQVGSVIDQLDSEPRRQQKVYAYQMNGDPQKTAEMLKDMAVGNSTANQNRTGPGGRNVPRNSGGSVGFSTRGNSRESESLANYYAPSGPAPTTFMPAPVVNHEKAAELNGNLNNSGSQASRSSELGLLAKASPAPNNAPVGGTVGGDLWAEADTTRAFDDASGFEYKPAKPEAPAQVGLQRLGQKDASDQGRMELAANSSIDRNRDGITVEGGGVRMGGRGGGMAGGRGGGRGGRGGGVGGGGGGGYGGGGYGGGGYGGGGYGGGGYGGFGGGMGGAGYGISQIAPGPGSVSGGVVDGRSQDEKTLLARNEAQKKELGEMPVTRGVETLKSGDWDGEKQRTVTTDDDIDRYAQLATKGLQGDGKLDMANGKSQMDSAGNWGWANQIGGTPPEAPKATLGLDRDSMMGFRSAQPVLGDVPTLGARFYRVNPPGEPAATTPSDTYKNDLGAAEGTKIVGGSGWSIPSSSLRGHYDDNIQAQATDESWFLGRTLAFGVDGMASSQNDIKKEREVEGGMASSQNQNKTERELERFLDRTEALDSGQKSRGLDLQGGTSHLVPFDREYLTPPSGQRNADGTVKALENAIEVLRKRVDALGVAKPVDAPANNVTVYYNGATGMVDGATYESKLNSGTEVQSPPFGLSLKPGNANPAPYTYNDHGTHVSGIIAQPVVVSGEEKYVKSPSAADKQSADKQAQGRASIQNGKLLYEAGKLDEAEKEMRKAAELNPDDPASFRYLSLIREQKEKKEQWNKDNLAKTKMSDVTQSWLDSPTRDKLPEPTVVARTNREAFAKQLQKVVTRAASDQVVRTPTPLPTPQPEITTRDNAFSTFSLNVSDVSFKLAASSLENGVLPDPGSIRVEEFVNAFNYRDPAPKAGARLAFAWDRAGYPFAHNRDVLRFSIQTAARGRESSKPLNLVLLMDCSGSMERPDRVAIMNEALRVLAQKLQPQDKISVVAFARTPRLWVDGMPGGKPQELLNQVLGLNPEGGTNLEEAMNLAYATALRHFVANGVNRVILLTDGAANLGNIEPEALKEKVVAHRAKGIALDCFGIGWEGYNDDLLEVLSRNGDGRYAFLDHPEDAAPEFANQLAGALNVAAKNVKAQVQWNPARVQSWRQIGYAKHQLTKEQFRDNTVDAAEIAAAESGNALYVIEVNPQGTGPLGTVRCRYQVPETGDYVEQEWELTYEPKAAPLDQAAPALRLASTAAAFGEWLSQSQYAADVNVSTLQKLMAGIPEVYSPDPRPQRFVSMLRQAQALSGK